MVSKVLEATAFSTIPNQSSIIIWFRYLDHQNVVKFFGAVKITTRSNGNSFAFISTFCDSNLRSIIENDKTKTPAKGTSNIAINLFLKWATEIADALGYIHEKDLVHRHLKLENIMVSTVQIHIIPFSKILEIVFRTSFI